MEEDLRVIFSTSFHPRQTPESNPFSFIFILNVHIHSITEAYLIYLWIIFKSLPFTLMSLPWALIISCPNSGLLSSCLCCAVLCLVAQSCPTLCDAIDCSLPGSSIHGTFQARILEWVAMSSSGGSSQPGDWTQVSHIAGGFFTFWATREAYLLAYLPQTLLMLLLELSTQATILTSLWPSFQPPHLLPVSSSLLYSQQHQTTYSSPSTLNYIAQGHYPLLVLFLLPNPFFFNNKTTTWLQLTIKNAKRIKRKLYSTQILIPRR